MLIVLLTVVQNLGHCQLTLLYTLLIFLAVLMILKLGLIQQLLHIIHTANFQMHGFFQIDYLCLHILNLLLQFSLTFCLLDQLKVEFFVETVQISEFIPQLFNSFYVNSVLLKLCGESVQAMFSPLGSGTGTSTYVHSVVASPESQKRPRGESGNSQNESHK